MYYLRSKPATNAIKFTVDVEAIANEISETDGVDIKIFNKTGKENEDVNLKKRKPTKEPKKGEKKMMVCPIRRRRKKGEQVSQEEEDDCMMCGA
jgi:hypothetical protein